MNTRVCWCTHAGAGVVVKQHCWLPQIFLQHYFDCYAFKVKENTAIKRRCFFQHLIPQLQEHDGLLENFYILNF